MARLSPLFALLTLLFGATVLPIEPAEAVGRSEILELAELLPDPTRIHPDIAAQVDVDLQGIGIVGERLSAARAELNDARSRSVRSFAAIGSLQVQQRLLQADLRDRRSDLGTADALLEAADRDLGVFAVDTFLEFEDVDLGALRLEGDVDPAETMSDHVGRLLTHVRDGALARRDAAKIGVDELSTELDELTIEISALTTSMEAAQLEQSEAQILVDEYEPAFELALLGARVKGVEFPVVVLDAYYRAELIMAEDRPSCGVRWDHLAGIGRVESYHGTYGGNTVGADGRTSGEILGPVLDGDPWQAISDTDGGEYDGDIVWDRAVGPMQFIPGSWARYGSDANGDGEADPHNLYDAALAAAHHLCGTTGGLGEPANFQRVLLGYNRSVPYGISVMSFADGYLGVVGLEAGPDSRSAGSAAQRSSA